ncbi:MAG TPA: M1 family metallopeptidase [Gemmatimonadota bacterium]|nr:M1 family metallopeptidase [Gemmatimonadota bacterium]
MSRAAETSRAAARRFQAAVAAACLLLAPASGAAQSRPAPVTDPSATLRAGRPLPGPVYETPEFSRAVARGTRTRTGRPGPSYWVQRARYDIDARLDLDSGRVTGRETVWYLNRSPDTLRAVAVYLRQNVFAPGSPRLNPAPVTGGLELGRVAAGGAGAAPTELEPVPPSHAAMPITEAPPGLPDPGRYAVHGTVMWLGLRRPLLPDDSVRLELAWSYRPAPAPADGREGHDDGVWYMGYWYPQVAVYDDVEGWVTDAYLDGAEFYMDPADYDVRLTVPSSFVVDATGTLRNPEEVLPAAVRDSLAAARRTGRVVHVATPADREPGGSFSPGGRERTWHFTVRGIRDFSWGASDTWVWDATRALVGGSAAAARAGSEGWSLGAGVDAGAAPDTVMIHSFYRLTDAASAWRVGGARFTRDAIERLSDWLWPYPWPHMTSMEGVLDSGGMEYPMMTLMQPWADTLSLAGDLMHETGHMWFPMQVGSNEKRFPWMDEGLTQFDVAQGMRAIYGEPREGGRPNDSEAGQRRLYVDTARAGHEGSLMRHGDRYPTSLYFVMYYDKTAQVLAALRSLLGEETFHRGLRTYGRRWVGRHPYPYDFFDTFDEVSGRDLSWYWRTWFYEPWPLDQALGPVRSEGDSVAITVRDVGLAPMPVRLAVTRADGSVQRVEVPVEAWLDGAREHVVRVGARPEVVKVEIDPEAGFPDIDRSNQVWERGGGGA